MSQLEGQPAYVADAITLLLRRRSIIETTVLSAWQTGKRERLAAADDVAEGAGVVLNALAQLARPEVAELVALLQERAGLARAANGGC